MWLGYQSKSSVNREGDLNLYRAWAFVNTKVQFVEAGDPKHQMKCCGNYSKLWQFAMIDTGYSSGEELLSNSAAQSHRKKCCIWICKEVVRGRSIIQSEKWKVIDLQHTKFKRFLHQLRFTVVPWILCVHHIYGLKLSEQYFGGVSAVGRYLLCTWGGHCVLASSLCPPSRLQIQTTNHKWELQEFTSKPQGRFPAQNKMLW